MRGSENVKLLIAYARRGGMHLGKLCETFVAFSAVSLLIGARHDYNGSLHVAERFAVI